MLSKISRVALLLLCTLSQPALAGDDTVKIVASFTILGDMVHQIGKQRVAITTLVGPDGDPHVYTPSPTAVKAVAKADLVVMNGLGFEGWMERLLQAADYRGETVVASENIPFRHADSDEEDHHEDHHAGHEAHGGFDPHAWHDLRNGARYVDNIAAGLMRVDPAHAAGYRANADAYKNEMLALHAELSAAFAPLHRLKVVVPHAAFDYFAAAYGITFLSPQGLNTEAKPSAGELAALIRQIRHAEVQAVFLENIADPRLIRQLETETGVRFGGTLYSGALSAPGEKADTYLKMFRYNADRLLAAAP